MKVNLPITDPAMMPNPKHLLMVAFRHGTAKIKHKNHFHRNFSSLLYSMTYINYYRDWKRQKIS